MVDAFLNKLAERTSDSPVDNPRRKPSTKRKYGRKPKEKTVMKYRDREKLGSFCPKMEPDTEGDKESSFHASEKCSDLEDDELMSDYSTERGAGTSNNDDCKNEIIDSNDSKYYVKDDTVNEVKANVVRIKDKGKVVSVQVKGSKNSLGHFKERNFDAVETQFLDRHEQNACESIENRNCTKNKGGVPNGHGQKITVTETRVTGRKEKEYNVEDVVNSFLDDILVANGPVVHRPSPRKRIRYVGKRSFKTRHSSVVNRCILLVKFVPIPAVAVSSGYGCTISKHSGY